MTSITTSTNQERTNVIMGSKIRGNLSRGLYDANKTVYSRLKYGIPRQMHGITVLLPTLHVAYHKDQFLGIVQDQFTFLLCFVPVHARLDHRIIRRMVTRRC